MLDHYPINTQLMILCYKEYLKYLIVKDLGYKLSSSCNSHKEKAWTWSFKKRQKPSSKNWQETLADELHKPIKRNFTRRRVIVNHVDEIWAADLVEMQQLSKWNKGYEYLLMVIDIFSKYGWIVPLKDKKGETVTKAFQQIFKEGKTRVSMD